MIPGYAGFVQFAGNWLGGARGWLFFAIPLLLIGRMVAKKESHSDSRWALWLALSVGCVAVMLAEALTLRRFFGSTGIDMTLLMPATVFCILNFLRSVRVPQGAYQLWMRKMSLLIFVTQRIFLSVIPGLVGERCQILFIGRSDEDHVAAVTAVAAVRTAFGDKLFPTETAAAVAAVTSLD
jgi:hypothetical protein